LHDNLCDYFICGLCSQHVKQKLLSPIFTFQECKAITQEAAHKDSHGGEAGASGGVNEMKCDNRKSRGRFQKRGKGHARDGKSGQPTGDNKQDNCRYKGTECFKFHKTGHLQSKCPHRKPSPKPWKEREHVRLAEGSEELGASDSEDCFRTSIFISESESHDSKISAPAVKVPDCVD